MKMILFARLSLCLVLLSLAQVAVCQDVTLKYNGSGSYSYIERTNLRRYDNGKYVGLVNREVRSFIARTSAPAGANPADSYYDGSFFVDESTVRNYEEVRDSVSGAIPSSFKISPSGELTMLTDFGYPSFRSFPAFPTQKIKVGDKWQAKAERVVDPLNKGIITKMPILVEYTYLQDDVFNDEAVYVFSAQWATRYGLSYWDFSGDKELKSAQGSHKATMYVSKRTGNALVVRDQVDETFVYKDGGSYAFKGTISMFTEYPPAYDKRRLYPALQRVAGLSEEELERILQKPTEGAEGTAGTGAAARGAAGSASGKGSAKGAAATSGSTADKGAAPTSTKGASDAQAASTSGKTTGGSAATDGVAQAVTSEATKKDKGTGDAAAGGSAGSSASSNTSTLGSASPSKNTAAANAGTAGTTGSTDGSAPPQAGIASARAASQQSGTSGDASGAGGSGATGGTNGSGASGAAGSAGSSEGTPARDQANSDASGGTQGGDGSNSALSSASSGSAALSSQDKQSSKSAKSASSKSTTKQPKASKADIERKIASAQGQASQRGSSQPSGTGAPKSASSSAAPSAEKKVTVENTSSGIRLTMQNLNFKPDSAELLPGEAERLDQIAAVLKEVSDQMFLVEGHTASVGKVAGEKQLSIERANAIAEALVKRGIPRERFICKGSGGTKPVADNSTQQGRAKNRRVEITILE